MWHYTKNVKIGEFNCYRPLKEKFLLYLEEIKDFAREVIII